LSATAPRMTSFIDLAYLGKQAGKNVVIVIENLE
jgi:arginine decarboxylase-like protein